MSERVRGVCWPGGRGRPSAPRTAQRWACPGAGPSECTPAAAGTGPVHAEWLPWTNTRGTAGHARLCVLSWRWKRPAPVPAAMVDVGTVLPGVCVAVAFRCMTHPTVCWRRRAQQPLHGPRQPRQHALCRLLYLGWCMVGCPFPLHAWHGAGWHVAATQAAQPSCCSGEVGAQIQSSAANVNANSHISRPFC